MEVRIWTLDEANALVPRLESLVAALRVAHADHRFALEQIGDLQRQHGPEAIREPTNGAHAEYARFVSQGAKARARLEEALAELDALGVEVKDPVLGLVDFPTLRGRDVVYLCWQPGERVVTHWHGLTAGFKGRKPLDDLVRASGR